MSIPRILRALWAPLFGVLLAALAFAPAASASSAASAASAAPAASAAKDAIRGGDPLYSSDGVRCTVGVNAARSGTYYAVLPGGCGAVGTRWYADPQLQVPVGETVDVRFPKSHHTLVRYTNPDLSYPSEVNGPTGPRRIERVAEAVVGAAMCRTGPVTGWHCGVIQAVNVSVSYPEGVVFGLIRANVCAEPGDTGGPAFMGDALVGFLVGGSGNCATGGVTFYLPVAPVLQEYGLSVGY
ncbi:S1 family peptidase [Streptomyces boncukensis]|uniref:Trypsin-like serine protease n=1 Tax=Streptomyces boncukensis TaxID=2711219 RepID=A0A6G4WVT3_9ACTN|nr:S1 family peptidase [Streptomyces boncukensis]NGO68581.1 trypsin-like serine protease [Streptomyces boncukensis]